MMKQVVPEEQRTGRIVAFSGDLKKISVSVLVMRSEDDQIVPYQARRSTLSQAPQERHAEDVRGLPRTP